MSSTANYNLNLLEKNTQNWDVPINDNFSNIDSQIKARENELDIHLADYVRQPGFAETTGSTVNTYVITLNPAPITYTNNMGFDIKINVANTGTSTLNVNGLGAKIIKDSSGNNLTSDALKQNQTYRVRYDSISGNFILASSSSSTIVVGTATENDLLAGKTATIPTGVITGNIQTKSGITYTPTTSDQIITSGYYDETCKVKGDPNHVPPNIKAGVVDFGITGTFTSDATATAPHILNGDSAYVNGIKIFGTMTNNGAVVISPSISNIVIAGGFHTGQGYVKGEPNYIASNIVNTASLWGLQGTAVQLPIPSVGDSLLISSDIEITTSASDMTKMKEIKMLLGGTVRVKFDLKSGTASAVHAQVYVNGVARGTYRMNNTTTYITYTEDFTVNANDLIQIYCDVVGGTAYTKNFRICIANNPYAIVNL